MFWLQHGIIKEADVVERMRPLKNALFYSRSRKTRILTAGIPLVFRGSIMESDAEIGQKRVFFKGLGMSDR
jgi:hypothetical protein